MGRPTVPGSAWPARTSVPVGALPHQLLDEPGLADAGLAGHQRHGRFGARAHEGGQAVELDRPAHHHG